MTSILFLVETIQMDIWEKQKYFSLFLCAFFKFTSNFGHFQKKDDPHSLCIFEITVPSQRGQI